MSPTRIQGDQTAGRPRTTARRLPRASWPCGGVETVPDGLLLGKPVRSDLQKGLIPSRGTLDEFIGETANYSREAVRWLLDPLGDFPEQTGAYFG
jgi:hypothetical protein